MRFGILLVAASLLAASAAVPGAEAARDPVGGCGSGAIVQVCAAPCFNPPCPVEVCVDREPVSTCGRP